MGRVAPKTGVVQQTTHEIGATAQIAVSEALRRDPADIITVQECPKHGGQRNFTSIVLMFYKSCFFCGRHGRERACRRRDANGV